MGAREASVHRKGPGDVGREVAVFRSRVDQEEVAVHHLPIILRVVQNAGVGPRSDDRWVAVSRRSFIPEHELHGGLGLVFPHPRLGSLHGGGVAGHRDLCRTSEQRGLRLRLAKAQFGKERGRVDHGMRNDSPKAVLEGREPPHLSQHVVVQPAAPSVVEPLTADEMIGELATQLGNGIGGIGPVVGDRSFDPTAVSVPDLHFRVSWTDEEHIRLGGVGGIDDRHRVGLVEAGEEEEVGVLAKLEVDIMVPGAFARPGDDGHGPFEGFGKSGSPSEVLIHERQATGYPRRPVQPSRRATSRKSG